MIDNMEDQFVIEIKKLMNKNNVEHISSDGDPKGLIEKWIDGAEDMFEEKKIALKNWMKQRIDTSSKDLLNKDGYNSFLEELFDKINTPEPSDTKPVKNNKEVKEKPKGKRGFFN